MGTNAACLGILLPEDGPPDYEWYDLASVPGCRDAGLPQVAVGQVTSDGHHEPGALRALGAVERLRPVGEALLRDHGPAAIVWACTSASFIGGLDWARAQSGGLSRALGIPATSTALAFRDALAALGHDEADLLSPYPDIVTRRLVRFLREGGVETRRIKALDCPYAEDSHRLDIRAEVRRFAAEYPASHVPLLVPDTAVNTLALCDELAVATARPVLTANQVSLWSGLRLMGADARPTALGILRDH